ncbi:TSUP family transporter [Microtetraspora malaysiensis]|uniref:TSUP family transporter n=1 Tax=Microtetraspora malaysiensis TaxID=161358 RepID=UPI003D91654C
MPVRVVTSFPLAFTAGAAVGALGGMIGLGGAEFRLPLLIGLFGFAALVLTHTTTVGALPLPGPARAAAGVVAGFGIGVVAAIMGVAGGELLIPTIVLLYAIDIKVAGSLSLLVSLPTMLVAFARYSRDGSFIVLRTNLRFTAIMVAGSIAGALLGGLLLGMIADGVLIPALAVILLISAAKLARHAAPSAG